MRKKTITILLTIVLVLALVGVAVAEALQESNTTNLQIVTDASGALDGKSTLKVTVSNKAKIDLNALTFHVDFDTNKLEVTNIAFTVNGNTVTAEDDLTPNNGEVKGGGHSDVSEANTSGTAGFYYMDVTEAGNALSAQANDVQAVITFKVKSGLTADSTGDIKLYEDSASNGIWFNLRKDKGKVADSATVTFSGEDLPGVTVSGSVTSYLVADGTVTLKLLQNSEVKYSTTTTTGSYSFDAVAEGTYQLQVSKANHVMRTYDVTVNSATTQDVKICPVGDVNGDGNVNVIDYAQVLAHAKKVTLLTGYSLDCGNVNRDASVNVIDYAQILAHAKKVQLLW